jgi:hypothetical protein
VAEAEAPGSVRELHAVNIETTESDLAKADAAPLAAFRFDVRTDWQEFRAAESEHAVPRQSLSVACLYLALALLLIESFLAGRHAPLAS